VNENEITKSKPRYHWLRRFLIFVVVLVILSLIDTHTPLQGNQIFADASLLVAIVLVFGLRRREQ
jgi:amino acid permease